jgi:hypothetical protein
MIVPRSVSERLSIEMLNSGRDEPVACSSFQKAIGVMKFFIYQFRTLERSPGTIESPVSEESNMRLLPLHIEAAATSR